MAFAYAALPGNYFNRFKNRVKKYKMGKEHAEQNIFRNCVYTDYLDSLADHPFLQWFFYRFQQIAASSCFRHAYTFTNYFFNCFIQKGNTTPANSSFSMVGIYAIIQSNC